MTTTELAAPSTAAQAVPEQSIVFDVFLSDPFRVDLRLFDCWTRGECESDAIRRQRQQASLSSSSSSAALTTGAVDAAAGEDDVSAHTRHQYHFFRLLAEKLERPCSLIGRLELHLPPESQPAIIEKYYAFDDALARELVGKKLTFNLRRDVDDIAESTGISLPSCMRQFDNLRRVWKVAMSDPTREVVTFVGSHFRLPRRLAERYVRFAFLAEYRPAIGEKRIQALRYEVIEDIAQLLIVAWTNRTNLALELSFHDVRDAKARVKRDVEGRYRQAVVQQLAGTRAFSVEESLGVLHALDGKFRSMVKSLASIGSEIADWKEFRDIFENLLTKVVDPLRTMGVTKQQIGSFFDMLIMCADPDVIAPKHRPAVAESWKRFLVGMKDLALILFEVVPPI